MPELTARAQKDLDGLPERLREKADVLIARLDNEPALGKKLLGRLADKRSLHLGRTHRIIYTTGPVRVLAVPLRRDAYR
jgi:mRNA-degrading endonuclease RelE of RelBE toxin-antitoxin system